MAKVKFSALITEMRNKLNGSVFSKNRAGNYLRNKTSPVQPRTQAQMFNRAGFGALSQLWAGLSQTQRDAWIAAAPDYPRTDVFGDVKIPSGQQLFMELNRNLQLLGSTARTLPADKHPMPRIDSVTLQYIEGALVVTVDAAGTSADFIIVVEATPPLSPGKEYMENQFRRLTTIPSLEGDKDIVEDYTARFGALVPSSKIGVRVFMVNKETGQAGVKVPVNIILPATL